LDFEKEIQFRTSDPSRHRKVKRETSQNALNIKGIAGLRLHEQKTVDHSELGETSRDNLDSSNQSTETEIGAASNSQNPPSVDQITNLVSDLQTEPEPDLTQDF
jgi:hypothetical protein